MMSGEGKKMKEHSYNILNFALYISRPILRTACIHDWVSTNMYVKVLVRRRGASPRGRKKARCECDFVCRNAALTGSCVAIGHCRRGRDSCLMGIWLRFFGCFWVARVRLCRSRLWRKGGNVVL